MSSLREIKDRIASVRSTLKITSAMKLVSSAKLRKAQKAIEGLRPYESALDDILSSLLAGGRDLIGTVAARDHVNGRGPGDSLGGMERSGSSERPAAAGRARTTVVVISSNSSLCGAFNSNVIRRAFETIHALEAENRGIEVCSIGRKAADALSKAGYPSREDYSDLVAHPGYEKTSVLAKSLLRRFGEGELEKVVLVYNHFVTTARQVVVEETYLPFEQKQSDGQAVCGSVEEEYIVEPGAAEVVETLLPQVVMLKLYAAILDSQAAEQAARTVAMQTASDNAEQLLGELTLEYNKGRQQKITAEILDLLGGSAAQ